MSDITLLRDQLHTGSAFVEAHERSARASGVSYADALWRHANGRQLSGEWFENCVIAMNRTVASVYRAHGENACLHSDVFVRRMVVTASRAMWKRLDQLDASARERRAA